MSVKKRILLIDDETIFHFINKKVISISGVDCEVLSANDGIEGLEMVKKGIADPASQADVIFIDLKMPDMDGFGFLRAFQQLNFPGKERIKLVVMSSSSDQSEMDQSVSLGAQYLPKPLTEDAFRSILA